MWCGLRPNPADPEICSYYSLPGYGNNWDQRFGTVNCLNVSGDVIVHFLTTWDSEPGYDGTCVEWDMCDDNWINTEVASNQYYFTCIDGWDYGELEATIADSLHSGQMRIRFHFRSDGAWSDEDGFWQSDGAFILDSLSVNDSGGLVIPIETFETEAVGDHTTTSGNWTSSPAPGYGDFAGLFSGLTVLQEDVCNYNTSCLWGFFNGSTYNYACGGYPLQPVVPFGNERDQYLRNDIWSPWVTLSGSGDRIVLEFDVYGDLKFDPLVFYFMGVRSLVDGCAGRWDGPNQTFFEPDKVWKRNRFVLDSYIDPAATAVQIRLGAFDTCPFRCGVYGTGLCHSHSPLFDNVTLYRVDNLGPEFDVSGFYLFQDNFASDGTTTGTVRADMAADILPSYNPVLRPGDSTAVSITTPPSEPGLSTDPHTGSGPAAYAYVAVWPDQSAKRGAALTDDPSRWPVVDSLTHGGTTWFCVRMDTVYSNGSVVNDRYCVDLNDNLFTPGDTVCYFFAATSSAITTYWSEFTGRTESLGDAATWPMEFTCLPTGLGGAGPEILYVDYNDGSGAQTAFEAAFEALGYADGVDRFDVRGSSADNGPGSRVTNVQTQLVGAYDIIVWGTGTTQRCLGDGSSSGKSDDASLLASYLGFGCTGVYFSGDDIAAAIDGADFPVLAAYIDFSLDSSDHIFAGYDDSPLIAGEPGGCFDDADADTLVAFRGCYPVNHFDAMTPTGSATLEASYLSGAGGGAIVAQRSNLCVPVGGGGTSPGGVILSGFGFESIQNDKPSAVLDATAHMAAVIDWLLALPTSVDSPSPRVTALAQNYPNPFNPATTIRFSVREKARVQLKIYNVAGQLVTTLVDRVVEGGLEHAVDWDGRNDAGARVATGVYFYRMTAPDFTRTRKMVLLK